MERTAGQRIAGNLSWLGLQELIGRLIGFFMLIYLARLLSPADYGSLNICMALMAILSLLVRAGTGSRATRLTARDAAAIPGIHSDVAGLRIVIAVVLIISIALLCVPLGSLLSVPPQLLLLGSALLVRPALTVAWAFRGLDNMRPIALSGAAERLLVLVGLLLLVHGSNLDMYIVMLLEIAGAIIVVWWLRLSLYRNLGSQLQIRFNYRRWGSMVRESWAVSMATIIGSLYRHGDALLLGALDCCQLPR
jgi:O-antigen/teichoic acid export membrane protein